MADELTIGYNDAKLGQRLRQFALDHPSSKWRQYTRLNRETIVVAAVNKER